MKFAAIIAAIATVAATANAATCPAGETQRLLALAQEATLPACETESEFNFLPPSGIPSQEQLDRMCLSEACTSTLAALRAIAPADCDTTFSNGVTLNVKSVVDLYTTNCGARRALRNAVSCPAGETQRLLALAQEASLPDCEAESKFNFLPPSGVPSQEELDAMCLSEACTSTLSALRAIAPADCDTTFSNGVTLNVKSVVDLYLGTCGGRRNLRN